MPKPMRLLSLAIVLLLPLLGGCGGRELLHSVEVRPAVISPNADGTDDVAELKYALSAQSTINIYLLDTSGARHDFRVDKRRSKGQRTAYFGGVIDDRLLPDGDYTVVFEATAADGRTARVEQALTIVDGDKELLEIRGLSVWPKTFTPNRDGITDRVKISYVLSKPATRVEAYILGPDGTKYPVAEDKIREMGAPGAHEHDYDAGIDLGATPPPDGEYTVVVEAEDAVGNRARVTDTLAIQGGGVPRVEIVNAAADFSATTVALGETLTFTCTVKNIGTVPVRTKGPESGATYIFDSENFNTKKEYEEPGIFRVGLDFEGNASRIYPFRWQLGADEELTVIETEIGPQSYLMPGQTVTVTGTLHFQDRPVMTAPHFWLGLIHEQVWVVQDRVEPTAISIGF